MRQLLCSGGAQRPLFTTHPFSFLVGKGQTNRHAHACGKLFSAGQLSSTTHGPRPSRYRGPTHRFPTVALSHQHRKYLVKTRQDCHHTLSRLAKAATNLPAIHLPISHTHTYSPATHTT